MSDFKYHEVIPENLRTEYSEYDNIDFILSFPNRSMNVGSVCIEGELIVQQNGSFIVDQDIKLDHLVGSHSLWESITTTANASAGGQVLENLTEYPRYAKMGNAATMGQGDACNSENVCELKTPFDQMTIDALQCEVPVSQPTLPVRLAPDFSCKPLMCLNSGRGSLPHRRSGDLRVSVNLARVNAVLFGVGVSAQTTYVLKDLKLTFTSVPDDGSNEPVVLKTKLGITQSIQTGFANVQTRVPAVCSAMTASFQVQVNANTPKNNNLDLNKVPNLTQTQFLWNDSTNTLISYIIKSNSEVIDRAISSMVDTGKNSLSTQNLANNNGFLLGLDFDSQVDLSNQKFSLQLTSDINSGIPMIVYMYFHSQVNL